MTKKSFFLSGRGIRLLSLMVNATSVRNELVLGVLCQDLSTLRDDASSSKAANRHSPPITGITCCQIAAHGPTFCNCGIIVIRTRKTPDSIVLLHHLTHHMPTRRIRYHNQQHRHTWQQLPSPLLRHQIPSDRSGTSLRVPRHT
jgi:hypothetical protein